MCTVSLFYINCHGARIEFFDLWRQLRTAGTLESPIVERSVISRGDAPAQPSETMWGILAGQVTSARGPFQERRKRGAFGWLVELGFLRV